MPRNDQEDLCPKCGNQHERRSSTRFRLSRLHIRWINIDSEPTQSPLSDRDKEEGWTDIVVRVVDRGGNEFEVSRITCRHYGILGEAHAAARLVRQVSWDHAFGDNLICPLCHERGHGAGACPRS